MTLATLSPTLTPPTDAELQRAADEPGIEFFDGELQEKPMGAEERGVAATVVKLIGVDAEKSKAGRVFVEVGYRCYPGDPRKFRKPDVSFIRAERLPASLKGVDVFAFPADLAVEVVSPNDTHYEVEKKVREYLEAGFKVVWIVNPDEKSVTIRRPDRSVAVLYADDEVTGEDFLPGFRCKVAAFFE